MIHEYQEDFDNFLDLFDIKPSTVDSFDEAIEEDISQSFYYHFKEFENIDWEILRDHIKYTYSVPQYLLEEIEDWFNSHVDGLFDEPVTLKIKEYNHNGKVQFTIESDHLKSQIGQGMDGYGYFDWSSHPEEDKQTFLDDGYLALRELLHYYEACESKPHINFYHKSTDCFWEFDCPIEDLRERIKSNA